MIAQPSPSALENRASPFLTSPLLRELEVRHGFTTRQGGVSEGRYASLNLGETWGDDPARVKENLSRVATAGGFFPAALCQVAQVHSTDVVAVTSVEKRKRQADGMATLEPLCLGAYSADCACLLFGDGKGRVAAVHAGWRGTVAGIAARAVERLLELGADVKDIRVAIGPSIGPCCFEVKADVAAPFADVLPGSVSARKDGRLFVDLRKTNRHFLQTSGVLPLHIDDTPPCTYCDSKRFFSYRRDGAGIGQHLAFIVGGGS